jgi:hypothetical protein
LLAVARLCPGKFVLDLFSGNGGVARACRAQGFGARTYDVED